MSLNAIADCNGTACDNVLVDNLYITANSSILVLTSGDESKLNCTGTDGNYVTLNTADKNHQLVYSALLAARTSNKPMQINVVAGSSGCLIERVEYGKYF